MNSVCNSFRANVLSAFAFVGIALAPCMANASPITIAFSGHIVGASGPPSPLADNIDGTGVFGTAGADLTGLAYTAAITYDPAFAPLDLIPGNPVVGDYRLDTPATNASFLQIAVTINGHTETVPGLSNYQHAIISDSPGQNTFTFATSNFAHIGSAFDTSFVEFDLLGKPGQTVVTSDALPISPDIANLSVAPNQTFGSLQITRGISAPGGNIFSAQTGFIRLGFDGATSWGPESTSSTAVPEPATLSLLLVGGLSAVRRLRRRRLADVPRH